jgi:hypothetical protein
VSRECTSRRNKTSRKRLLARLQVAAAEMRASRSRYAAYRLLGIVYRMYWDWLTKETNPKRLKPLASIFGQNQRKGRHCFRMLLELADSSTEAKLLSRWTRALEYALDQDTDPNELPHLFGRNGGIAGCARLAATRISRRGRERNDWL